MKKQATNSLIHYNSLQFWVGRSGCLPVCGMPVTVSLKKYTENRFCLNWRWFFRSASEIILRHGTVLSLSQVLHCAGQGDAALLPKQQLHRGLSQAKGWTHTPRGGRRLEKETQCSCHMPFSICWAILCS